MSHSKKKQNSRQPKGKVSGGLLKALQEYNRLHKIGVKKLAKARRRFYFRTEYDDRWHLQPNCKAIISQKYGVDHRLFVIAYDRLEGRYQDTIPAHILRQLEQIVPFVEVSSGFMTSDAIHNLIDKLMEGVDADEQSETEDPI